MGFADLMKRASEMREKLSNSKRLELYADTDVDGFVSMYLLTKYLKKEAPFLRIRMHVVKRHNVHPDKRSVLLDMDVEGSGFVIDHHKPVSRHDNVLNPYLFVNSEPHIYNTGFLVYLMYRREINSSGDLWKVALTSIADSTFDSLRRYYYGIEKKKLDTAVKLIGASLPNYYSEVYKRLMVYSTLDQFIRDDFLVRQREEFKRTLKRLINRINAFFKYKLGPVRFYQIDPQYKRYKSPLAGVLSKKYKHDVVAVGYEENGEAVLSLRCKGCSENLDVVCRSVARKYGGRGGGHPGAAALRVPLSFDEVAEELYSAILSINNA